GEGGRGGKPSPARLGPNHIHRESPPKDRSGFWGGGPGTVSARSTPPSHLQGQPRPCGLIPGPSTWKNRKGVGGLSGVQLPAAWQACTAASLLAATILFHAGRFFTPTTTTGHQADWNDSSSTRIWLWGGSATSAALEPNSRERSMVDGWSMPEPAPRHCP